MEATTNKQPTHARMIGSRASHKSWDRKTQVQSKAYAALHGAWKVDGAHQDLVFPVPSLISERDTKPCLQPAAFRTEIQVAMTMHNVLWHNVFHMIDEVLAHVRQT